MPSRRSRSRIAAAAALVLGGLAWMFALPAGAAAPNKDGWWSEINTGTGIPAPVPPQVPSNGLYIENGYSGPVAIAALTFAVPAGAAVGSVTLQVAGSPILTKPPVACPIAPASLGYKAVQDGAWTARPTYQCSVAQVTGTVSSGDTSVSFDAGPLLRDGTVALVILPGGPADAVAFDPPGSDALAIVPAGSPPPAPATPSTGTQAPNPAGTAAASGGTTSVGGSGPVSSGDAGGSSSPSVVPAGSAAATPGAAPAGTTQPIGNAASTGTSPSFAATGNAGTATAASRAGQSTASRAEGHGGTSGTAWRRDLAEWFGLAALAAAMIAWSEGFGLLGGRIRQVGKPQEPPILSSEA